MGSSHTWFSLSRPCSHPVVGFAWRSSFSSSSHSSAPPVKEEAPPHSAELASRPPSTRRNLQSPVPLLLHISFPAPQGGSLSLSLSLDNSAHLLQLGITIMNNEGLGTCYMSCFFVGFRSVLYTGARTQKSRKALVPTSSAVPVYCIYIFI